MASYLKFYYESNIFEIFVGLNDVHWLTCVMQSKSLKNLDKVVCNLSAKKCKISMETFQIDELGKSKGNQHEFSIIICFLRIITNMFQTLFHIC